MKDIKDILKPGIMLKDIKIINYDDPEEQEKLLELREKSEACLKSKFVNWERLSKMYMTI